MESQTIRKGAGVLPGATDVSGPIMKEPSVGGAYLKGICSQSGACSGCASWQDAFLM